MTEHIFRYEIPVDDQWHDLDLYGPIVHIACRRPDTVEVWAVHHDHPPHPGVARISSAYRAVGTGQPIPGRRGFWQHIGTCIAPGGDLVWHLIKETL